jgi:hypothetical protein
MLTSHRAAARPARAARSGRSLAVRVGAAALTASTLGVVGLSAPAQAATGVVIGASGDVASLKTKSGSLASHYYGKLSGPARVGDLVNIESTTSWANVANGGQDANIKRWANALKGKNIMVSFSHEPMAKQNIHMGSASTFIAAFKHVVSVFNKQGSTSVKWVWNVTSHSFRVKSSASEYGAKWYPGDAYVDYVAGESYNRINCGGKDTSFASQIKEIFAFANQHHKKFVAAEFASNAYSGRAAWINAAHSYIGSHKSQFAGAFYYNPTHSMCNWHLSTSAEKSALISMANGL